MVAETKFDLERRTGIGATDSPKILGLSRYGSALTVYEDKVGEPQAYEPSLPSWLGLRLQQTVGELYTTATGIQIRAANVQFRDPVQTWLVCHLDFRALGDTGLLIEAKTRSSTRGWGEDGTQHIPEDVWVQVQHEMMVTGATECHVAVLFGSQSFRIYPIQRDGEFITALRQKLSTFWHSHVIPRVPPPASGHGSDGAALSRLYPSRDGIRSATPEQSGLVRRYREAQIAADEAAVKALALKNRIIQVIAGHEGLEGPFGTITYRTGKDRAFVDWRAIADMLAAGVLSDEEYKNLIKTKTDDRPGYPTFRAQWTEEDA